MKKKNLIYLLALAILGLQACTPKAAPPEEAGVIVMEEVVDENLSPCPKFKDHPQGEELEDDYIIYKDRIDEERIDDAFERWKRVYDKAPAADGQRPDVYTDGIFFYEGLIRGETDSLVKKKYVDIVFKLYDEMVECYPNQKGFALSMKGFDLYYNYPNRVTKEEKYLALKKAIDHYGENAQDFNINPFIAMLVDMHYEEKVSDEEAKEYAALIQKAIAKGQKNCKGEACERWAIVAEYVPLRMEYFESVKGFYDCNYYVNKYYPQFQNNQEDCDIIRTVFSRLRFGGCDLASPEMVELEAVYKQNCGTVGPLKGVYDKLRDGDYKGAISTAQEVIDGSSDQEFKATTNLLIAKIYFSHLKNFSQARQYARKAAKLKSNWGAPYILIGTLYASSGPLCGPGRGWDSQVVTWPAIDKWQYAKKIDPSVAAEANKLINNYIRFMPSTEQIFTRTLKEGDSYKVGCWIQERTIIRAARK